MRRRGRHQPARRRAVPGRRRARSRSNWCGTSSCHSSREVAAEARKRRCDASCSSGSRSSSTRRASKDEILELYLNDIPLGQRGSFAIIGVSEAARLFFGKDVSNLSLAEAATIAGVIQSPSALVAVQQPDPLPRSPQRRAPVDGRRRVTSRRRRRTAQSRSRWPSSSARSRPKRRTSSTSSARQLERRSIPGLTTTTTRGRGRLHDARPAPAAPGAGRRPRRPDEVDQLLSRRKRKGARRGGAHRRRPAHGRHPGDGRRPLLQPVAVQPRDRRRAGSPARCSSRSSTSRRSSRRGARRLHRTVTPATIVDDSPTTWETDDEVVDAGELRRRVRRPDHLAAGARPLAQPRRRSRSPSSAGYDNVSRAVEAARRRHAAAAVSVDRARRLRSDAARDRHGLHALPESGRRCGRCATSLRITSGGADITQASRRRREPIARPRHDVSSSPT